jgi:aryl-phospho-beta-D-glucosidase BglC (GH1 family)
MKWLNLFPLTLFFCSLTGFSPAQAVNMKGQLVEPEKQNKNIIVSSPLPTLQRGINLGQWFTDINYFNPSQITATDLELIKGLGFDHVRLPIAPDFLFDQNNPQVLNPDYLSYIDRALDLIQAADLSVIVNFHPSNDFKKDLATDTNFVNTVAEFSRSLATHLNTRNPEQVFLELINEPSFNFFLRNEPSIDPVEHWNFVQTKLVNAIKQGAPDHSVILKGHDWGESIDSLLQLTPIQEPNQQYIYNFHFYEPMLFTHQGATWMDEEFTSLQNLPYPFNEEVCATAIEEIVHETAKLWAEDYCNQKWDAAKLETRIALAANWAQEHNVLLTANEFGVYRLFVRPEDRVAWLEDVRSLFEKYNIGWAMWDYASGFGLVREDENGDRIVDEQIATALGLTVPPILPPNQGLPTLPVIIPNPEIEFPADPPLPRRVPEPNAIAGFGFIIFLSRRFPRPA